MIAALTALISGFGGYLIAGAGIVATGVGAWFAATKSGAAGQRAIDTQKGMDDVASATKARSGVDALGDAAVDDKLRTFQRK